MSEQAKSEMSEQQAKHLRMLEDIFKRDRHIAELEHSLSIAERERDILADKVQFMGAQLVSLEASREYLLSQTEEFRNKRDEAKRELAELRREVASMRPVANAAIALELLNMGHYHEAHDGAEQFVDAVNRYMATTPHEVNHEPERN